MSLAEQMLRRINLSSQTKKEPDESSFDKTRNQQMVATWNFPNYFAFERTLFAFCLEETETLTAIGDACISKVWFQTSGLRIKLQKLIDQCMVDCAV